MLDWPDILRIAKHEEGPITIAGKTRKGAGNYRIAAVRMIAQLRDDEDQARRAFETMCNHLDGKPIERFRDETPEEELDAVALLASLRRRLGIRMDEGGDPGDERLISDERPE